jgi:ABC-type molybdate transport system permease subunit
MTILMTTPKTIEQRTRGLRRWRMLFVILIPVLLGTALLNLLGRDSALNHIAAGLTLFSSLLCVAMIRMLTRTLAEVERHLRIMRRYRRDLNGR